MKYNSSKKQAFNDWKRNDRIPNWAKIPKRYRVKSQRYYEILTGLKKVLDLRFDIIHCGLEHLGNYIESLGEIEPEFISNRDNHIDKQLVIYLGGSLWDTFGLKDNTGFEKHWVVEEINYSRLAEKMLGITEKNKLKCLGGDRWLVWLKK